MHVVIKKHLLCHFYSCQSPSLLIDVAVLRVCSTYAGRPCCSGHANACQAGETLKTSSTDARSGSWNGLNVIRIIFRLFFFANTQMTNHNSHKQLLQALASQLFRDSQGNILIMHNVCYPFLKNRGKRRRKKPLRCSLSV